ncbi:hypothetical protein G7Y89_g3383 [Cudoniella acicularis]|uniref:Cytochrome P450 n=1 Tax=Cudoniella acicularis TaxID=354080 RepID=A0A8H4W609_9HELO|nr:hypothetical protein G7Y89_g3383 [Cudoniella acicularis]
MSSLAFLFDRAVSTLRQYPITISTVVVFFLVAYTLIARRFFHLRNIPGPWWACYTRIWLLKTLASEDSPNRYIETNRKYGPLARIGPNHLITTDPEAFRRILAARTNYQRGRWFDSLRLDPHNANLISEREWPRHNRLRQQMAPGYDGKDIKDFEIGIDENLQQWIQYIEEHGVTHPGQPVKEFEIGRSIQYLVTDMICRLCFGRALGFIENHTDRHEFLQTLEQRLPIVEKFSIYTEVSTLISFISNIPWVNKVLPSAEDKNGIGRIIGICREIIDERLSPESQAKPPKNDMLDSFLKHGLSRREAELEMTISLFAGSDTTATSIRAILLHIMSNPLIYARLRQEIDDGIAEGTISTPALEEQVRKLPYLQACIREGLRIFPPITYLRERVTPPQGDILSGHFIPGGVNIGFNLPGLLLNPVFEPDARTFRPERWLETEPEKLRKMERVMDLVFGWGSTRCLGIRMANANQSL